MISTSTHRHQQNYSPLPTKLKNMANSNYSKNTQNMINDAWIAVKHNKHFRNLLAEGKPVYANYYDGTRSRVTKIGYKKVTSINGLEWELSTVRSFDSGNG
jgi:hypothetical protein